MLQQRYRLRRSADLERVRQKGRSWRHALVILLVAANDYGISRFGFLASRRVGKAVMRNRAKRLLREAVRRHQNEVVTGWDCLFIARTRTSEATLDEVEAAVLQLLARAHLLAVNNAEEQRC
jgi:ribonuclease P protein component